MRVYLGNIIGSTAITVVSAFFQVQLCLCVCEDCFSLPNIKGDIAVVTDTLKEAWCADFNACHPVSSDIDILSQSFASYPNEKHVPLFKDTRVFTTTAAPVSVSSSDYMTVGLQMVNEQVIFEPGSNAGDIVGPPVVCLLPSGAWQEGLKGCLHHRAALSPQMQKIKEN